MPAAEIWIVACGAGILLGSIPFGVLWGRLFRGIDVRQHGSRNLGAANVFRVLGPAHGIVVLLLDAGKGAAAVALGRTVSGTEIGAIAAGLLAVLGHLFSPWVGFRGGKGVATGLGIWLLLAPAATGIALAAFVVALGISRRVSVGSLTATLALVPAVVLSGAGERTEVKIGMAVLTAGLVWVRHRANLVRLARGEEPPLWGRGER